MLGHSPVMGPEEKKLAREDGKGGPHDTLFLTDKKSEFNFKLSKTETQLFNKVFFDLCFKIFIFPKNFFMHPLHIGKNDFKSCHIFIFLTTASFFFCREGAMCCMRGT